MTRPKTYAEKSEAQALRMFNLDLTSIRDGFTGRHLTADQTAAEFRAACVEVARRLDRLAVAS